MKRTLFFLSILALLFSAAFLHFKYRQAALLMIEGFTQGTTYHIIVKQPLRMILSGATVIRQEEVDSLLHQFDLSLSTYVPESVISRINRNDSSVRTDKLFNTCFEASRRIYEETDGAFDITVGPLVDAWGFGPEGPVPVDSTVIDSLLQYVGMGKVALKGNRIIKKDLHILLDVNAIAQGLSVDVMSDFIEKKGLVYLYLYTLETKKFVKQILINFEKILDYSYSPDGKTFVMSAVKKGQSDIYTFNIAASSYFQITNDIYDDLHPDFFQNTSRIIFSSNRTNDTITFDEEIPENIPLNNDIFLAPTQSKLTEAMKVLLTWYVKFTGIKICSW